MKKSSFAILMITVFCLLLSNTTFAEKEASTTSSSVNVYVPEPYTPHSSSMLATDLKSGIVLYEQNPHMQFSPGSLTRIVTAIVAIENCEDLNRTITVPETILDGFDYDKYNIGLKYGETLSVKNLIESMLIHDAGDCAIVLGHTILNSNSEFVKQMNVTASKCGAKNTHFADTTGFNTTSSHTTLSDMEAIAKYAIQNEAFASIVSKEKTEISATNKYSNKRILYNTNNFISTYYSDKYYNSKIKGIKNYYNSADDCGCVTLYSDGQNNMLLLCAKSDSDGDLNYSYEDIDFLIDYSLKNFSDVSIVKKSEFLSEVKIYNGDDAKRLLLVSDSELVYKLPVNYDKSKIERRTTVNSNIKAPVKKGEILGKTEVYYNGTKCGEVNLVAYAALDSDTLAYIKHIIGSIVTSGYFITALILLVVLFIIRTININRRKKK